MVFPDPGPPVITYRFGLCIGIVSKVNAGIDSNRGAERISLRSGAHTGRRRCVGPRESVVPSILVIGPRPALPGDAYPDEFSDLNHLRAKELAKCRRETVAVARKNCCAVQVVGTETHIGKVSDKLSGILLLEPCG